MAAVPQSFYCLWQESNIRETLFSMLPKEDLASVRAANTACCNLLTKRLFRRTHVTFTPNTFTRPSRIQALSKIGHNIKHLIFYFPHSESTFLPPLVHPTSGQEITFLYTPHTSIGSVLTRPKYANSELGTILTDQYPPIFHSATNVPSFINAMGLMPNLRHITIKTPGQDPSERYRRDIVDYALISLRVSLERSSLPKLKKLSLESVHPSAFLYLRPLFALGCRPSAPKRWRQIRKLSVSVESWDFYGPSPGMDHLKLIDDFIRSFSSSLSSLTFTWVGRMGPCPLHLEADPLFAPLRSSKKLFNEVTSPMSPLPPPPSKGHIKFPILKFMRVHNATMNAPQISTLVSAHKDTVREFDFGGVALTQGTWDDSFAPLTAVCVQRSIRGSYYGLSSRSEIWARSDSNCTTYVNNSFRSISEEELVAPASAASEAANWELRDEELRKSFAGIVGEHGNESREEILDWAANTSIPCDNGELGNRDDVEGERSDALEMPITPPQLPVDEQYTYVRAQRLENDLASEIAAAREAGESFGAKFQRRKVRKGRRLRDPKEDESGYDTEKTEKRRERTERRERRERRERTDGAERKRRRMRDAKGNESGYETEKTDRTRKSHRSRSDSASGHKKHRTPLDKEKKDRSGSRFRSHRSGSRSRSHRKHDESIPDVPQIPEMPEVLEDEHIVDNRISEVLPPLPLLVRNNTTASARSNGSNKSSRSFRSFASFKSLRSRPSISEGEYDDEVQPPTPTMVISDPVVRLSDDIMLLQPIVYDPKGVATARDSVHNITAVQRNIEIEEHHRMLAEDEGMRTRALRKAKEIVLSKLSREFSFKEDKGPQAGMARRKKALDYTFSHGSTASSNNNYNNASGAEPRVLPMRNWWGKSVMSVASDCRTLDSQSAMVPLIISR